MNTIGKAGKVSPLLFCYFVFPFVLDIDSLKVFPALNLGTFLALIFIVAPVCGLRPFRAERSETEKVPKPIRVRLSPFLKLQPQQL